MRQGKNGPWLPVAIWYDDSGTLLCLKAAIHVNPHDVWTWVCRNPVSYEMYVSVAEAGKGWPDDVGGGTETSSSVNGVGHNSSGVYEAESLLEEIEAFVFVTTVLGELVAALCGECDGEEIPTAFDGRARGKLLHILTQTGSGFVEVGDLVFAERTTVDDRLEVGRLGILRNKVIVALDGLLEDTLAAGIRGRKCHGFGGENLSAQIIDHLKLVGRERRTGLGFFQAGECLVELTKVKLADTELDRRRLDENIGGITSDDGLVGGCGTFVIGAGKQAVGGFVFLGSGLRLSVECTRPEEKGH
jgi:hypothetical protein